MNRYVEKKRLKSSVIISFFAVFVLLFMTVGFALYGQILNLSGGSIFKAGGDIYIKSVTQGTHTNAISNPVINNGNSIDFGLKFTTVADQSATYVAVFDVTIQNDSFYDFVYTSLSYPMTVNRQSNGELIDSSYVGYTITGIAAGDVISSGESKTFTVSFTFTNPSSEQDTDTFVINGDFAPQVAEDTTAHILASMNAPTTGDLRGNPDTAEFSVRVLSTYSYDSTFDISISSDHFQIVDANGNPYPTQTITAGGDSNYTFYVKELAGNEYNVDEERVTVYVTPTGDSAINAGRISLLVDKTVVYVDTTPPFISNVNAVIQDDVGSVLVTWSGEDDTNISFYTVTVFNNSGSVVKTMNTSDDSESLVVTGLSEGTYYFVVSGTDESGNSGSDYVNSATTGRGHASRSTSDAYKWVFNVSFSCTNLNCPNTSTVNRNQTYTGTMTASGNNTLPESITVTMGGQTLGTGSYTYNNGRVSIPNVVGDVVITAEGGSCLIEGTKVLLANGKYKNIEDIKYDDLLMVWSYELGRLVPEYPLWIEKAYTTPSYIKITFSDNSTISIFNDHSFFSADENKFVNFKDREHFHIGTNVKKLNGDKLTTVSVTNIEVVNENKKYYFVASTRYYNIVSDDFITTDRYTDITNLYKFNDDITWSNDRVVKTIDYKYLEDVLPYYMYKGFRAGELAILLNDNRTNLALFKDYIKNSIIADNMLLPPIMKNNERYWMVTTDQDNMLIKSNYLVKEGDYYTLSKLITGRWYSTSENTYYNPGDRVQVWTGMHFIKSE